MVTKLERILRCNAPKLTEFLISALRDTDILSRRCIVDKLGYNIVKGDAKCARSTASPWASRATRAFENAVLSEKVMPWESMNSGATY